MSEELTHLIIRSNTTCKLFLDVLINSNLGYLTVDLYNGTGIRTQSVGNQTAVNTQGATIVIKSMIAGLQLSNSLGKNNYVKV